MRVPSAAIERSRAPSGLHATGYVPKPPGECPRSTRSWRPVAASKMRTVASAPVVAILEPSGLKTARLTRQRRRRMQWRPRMHGQLPARLGVEDPRAAVRARRRDARAVRADVDPDHRADRSARSRVSIEDEELLAGGGAPDAHRSLASGGGDESSAVRGERDVGVLVRLRPGQRQDFAAAGGGDVPDPRLGPRRAPTWRGGSRAVERDAPDRLPVAAERQGLAELSARHVPGPRELRPRRRWRRAARRG